jgi:hypothetical protein
MKSLIKQINCEFLETVDIFPEHKTDPALVSYYFNSRRFEISTSVSTYEGYKLLFSPSQNDNISEIVKRGLLISDLVILNHNNLPIEPSFASFAIPSWFPSKKYNYSSLKGKQVPPHMVIGGKGTLAAGSRYKLADGSYDGVPAFGNLVIPPDYIANWCLNEGKDLLKKGQVIYCPLLPPTSWEHYLYSKGINFQSIYKAYRLLPQEESYLDENVVRAFLKIDLPMIYNIDFKTLQKIKSDERESFEKFRSYIIGAINDLLQSSGSENFNKQLSRIENEMIIPAIEEIRSVYRKINKLDITRLLKIAFLTTPTILSFCLNSPEIKLLSPTLTLSGIIKEYLDYLAENIKEKSEIKSHPMYMLWRITGKATKDNKI